ncbi:metal ABC transporter solute-binding protein, Zn/Mn family [Rubrimonas cliftonensis]|uniref:Manganese/zinc/iron transport system substrate-binding protein n=1 Tax=Rubrimonas cliftonensis TaxID=89524 RepID=A0A1H3VWC1_9RHOB|nr:zinc ABC transporter substrate-binding protein [Rubrimonas cliftonensis]SDZ78358.1 manganese/zinc/iron transport system substrate-binding protein [Rubrimonas cliftonensis]
MLSRRALVKAGAALCAAPALAAGSDRLDVVATTAMIADAARAIGGDRVSVRALMGPGVDPHGYRQTRTDVLALSRAGLVLWNGLYLEAQLEELLLDLGARRRVVAVAEAAPEATLLAHADYAGRFDPHLWMAPPQWRHAVEAVAAALSEAQPAGADDFGANAQVYLDDMTRLDRYARETLASVPEAARMLVTAHDAFGYFGRAYGFDVEGVQGVSTEAEAGLRRIEELVALIVARRVPAVFVESSVAQRNVRALVEGAAAQGWRVSIGAELFADAMGAEGSYEGTYVGMIDHNVTVIARALGGAAPERGLNGRLEVAA